MRAWQLVSAAWRTAASAFLTEHQGELEAAPRAGGGTGVSVGQELDDGLSRAVSGPGVGVADAQECSNRAGSPATGTGECTSR